jgi:hypothetical protein
MTTVLIGLLCFLVSYLVRLNNTIVAIFYTVA